MDILTTLTPGLIGVRPRFVYFLTSSNLSAITTAGYLNKTGQVLQGFNLYPTDFLITVYSYVNSANPGTGAIFRPSMGSNGQITLIPWVDTGNVLLPVVSGNIPEFNGTTGQIQDSMIAASSLITLFGTVASGNIPKFDGTTGLIQDSLVAASNVMTLSGTNTMSGTGRIISVKANGTEAANAVTTNGMAGVITTSALTTAGGSSYAITWTNSYITSTSVISLQVMGGTNTAMNISIDATAGSGTSTLTIFNNTTATALNGTILIGYLVI